MLKAILTGIGLAAVASVLIIGAANRTAARSASEPAAESEQARGGEAAQERAGQEQSGQTGQGYAGGEQAGSGQTEETRSMLTLEGVVKDVQADTATITLADGTELIIEGRAWTYAQENGLTLQPGDQVSLAGFYDDAGTFETSTLTNLTQGTSLSLRDDAGRPAWAGRGRGGGQGGSGSEGGGE
jgi:hypothetical protein